MQNSPENLGFQGQLRCSVHIIYRMQPIVKQRLQKVPDLPSEYWIYGFAF